MAIEKMNEHYSFTNPASIYDEEALTALELAGRQAKKINEVVDAQNNLDTKTNETLDRFEKATIPAEVEDTVNKYIEKGTFDEAIGEHLNGLNDRVDNLLGKVTEGSTTMDAEVIDARMNPITNQPAYNLYKNLFAIFVDSLGIRNTPENCNANYVSKGIYWVSSGVTWLNVPVYEDTGDIIGGFLLSIDDVKYLDESITPAHNYQLFLGADGNIYFRVGEQDGGFFDWDKILTEAETNSFVENVMSPVKIELNNNTLKRKTMLVDYSNIDNISDNGFYFISSSQTYENLPDGENAGMLCCFLGLNNYSRYQLFFSFTGNMYMRNCNVDTTFKEWKRLATSTEISSGGSGAAQSYRYEIIGKTDIKGFEIYQKGNTGYIRYTFGQDPTYTQNRRLLKVEKLNLNRELVGVITDVGHDIEGVIYHSDQQEFLGGVHGSERYDEGFYFIDGWELGLTEIGSNPIYANNIEIIRKSTISTYVGSEDVVMSYPLTRYLSFGDTIEIRTKINDCYCELHGGMLSCYKEMTPYVINDYGIFNTPITDEQQNLYLGNGEGYTDSPYSIKTTFTGSGVKASIQFEISRLHKGVRYQITDYGDRYKAYYIVDSNGDNLYGPQEATARSILTFEC